MDCTSAQASSLIAAFSALTAIFSAANAYRSYRLARGIQDDAKSDERLVFGKISHPDLRTPDHRKRVLQIPVFNKSKRKAYVDGLTVYDRKSNPIEVTWSAEIDELGTPQRPAELAGIVDTVTLYVRTNVAEEIEYARVLISHSFSNTKQVVIFDPLAEFART